MYLMGFANPGVRPTGNLELVEFSLGNKYHPPEVRKQLQSNGICRVTATTAAMESNQGQSQKWFATTAMDSNIIGQLQKSNSNKSSSSRSSNGATSPVKKAKKRVSLEDLPADVYMEPLSPVLLRSPTERWVPSEPEETPVNWLQEDLASGQLAQEWWSFCIGKPKNDLQGKKKRKTFTSTFESVFADGGISIRVEHHPLESSSSSSSSEDEFLSARDSEPIGSGDEGYAQLLQHLESIKKAKVPLQQQQLQGDAPEDLSGVPIPVPSAFSPSLSSPILEKMEAYSWSKCAISNDLSESSTPRGDRVMKKTSKYSPTNVDALLSLKGFDLHSSRRRGTKTSTPKVVEVHVGEVVESQQDCPSPCSLTCGMSSTSLFSDEEDPFSLSVSNTNKFHTFDEQYCNEHVKPHEDQRNGSRKSPRSVLSQEPDEVSHGTSDSSETSKKHPRKQQQVFNYLYNDESSDLDSPMQSGFKYELPFPAFTYEASMDMGATTSDDDESSDEEDIDIAGSLQELGIFQEANQREPWLVNDGGVLDDSEDLEFLLSPTILHASPLRSGLPSSIQTLANQEMPETADGRIKYGSPKTHHESPKTHSESSKTQHGSPKTHQESPKTHHASPKTHHASSKTQRESPKTQRESPKTQRESPKTQRESSKTQHGSPKTHHESPKTHSESSKTQRESSKTQRESSKTQHGSPKTHHESPKTHSESSKTQHGSPKTHHESPKTHSESSKTQHGSPKTHHESSKTQQGSPRTHCESLKIKDDSLKTNYERANTKHESPKNKDESLKTKYDHTKVKPAGPKTKCHGSPKSKDENLKTKYEGPSTKHDSMRRPIGGDNKWVPYVTSKLFDDGSPRAQRIPIKRPQNPILINSAAPGQGKTSITKGESAKAPKRSVNFAVDLVKEIPYTSPPYSNIKPNPTAPQTKKPREVEVDEEEGPSIMTAYRNRWRKNRENVVVDDSKSDSKTTPSPSGSTRWSSWTKGKVANVVPSCTGKLLSWPKKLAFKVSNSKRWNAVPGSDAEDNFVGDGSFGVSARRDAELVRRILKGSQKKYSNLNESDIMRGDFR